MPTNPTERTATHEAGHGTIAECLGLNVKRIVLETFQDGYTDLQEIVVSEDADGASQLYRHRAIVALAGNASVRCLLGDAAAAQEKLEDLEHAQHDDEEARRCADAAAGPGTTAEQILADAELRVAAILARQEIQDAVAETAHRVRRAGRAGVTGAEVRDVLSAAGVRVPVDEAMV